MGPEVMESPEPDGPPKPVRWIGSSKKDVSGFPGAVRKRIGNALWKAQLGVKAAFAKPLKGFGGAGLLEVVADFDGDAFRAIYTVRFANAVYVLHAFQKKSKHGIGTPKADLAMIRRRLRQAEEDYQQWSRSGKNGSR
jgi:phage-related protein